ncbi:MAG: hypothetical protein ACM3ZT_07220 [Bacillota bacterium]
MSLPRPPSLALLLALAAVTPSSWADTPAAPPPATVASPAVTDPDILEFLADWQGDDGQWVDPMTFERLDPVKPSRDPRRHAKTPAIPPVPAVVSGAKPAQAEARRA